MENFIVGPFLNSYLNLFVLIIFFVNLKVKLTTLLSTVSHRFLHLQSFQLVLRDIVLLLTHLR